MSKPKTVSRTHPSRVPVWDHVLDNLEEGVVALDAEGMVRSMNQAAEELTGLSFGAVAGLHHSLAFRRNPWVSELVAEVQRKEGAVRAEGRLVGLWGRSVAVRASASPMVDSRGRRLGVALILHDLTVPSDLEADSQRARNLETLGGLVSALAHEIKNPLSGIRGAVQLLEAEAPASPAVRDLVRLVLREVDRLSGLLERLLELGSRRPVDLEGMNVHEAIDHVLSLAASEARSLGVAVVRRFDPSLPLVRGHRDSLVQVILNLVRNALQALASLPAGRPRELRVQTRIETDYHFESPENRGAGRLRFVRIEVEDNGPGIPPEIRPNLFSPFVTTKSKGSGLGLAISHRIVSDLGGTIRFESEPGRTVFRVILPVWAGR